MKILKRILLVIVSVVLLAVLGLWATGHAFILSAVTKTYLKGHSTANIDDHNYFPTKTVSAQTTQAWPLASNYGKNNISAELESYLLGNNSVAYLVAHNGELITENYFDNYSETSLTNSFSMAKTVVTLLVGIAIDEGYIESLEQNITDFLPEFKSDELGSKATIGSLSSMSSGYNWDENYYNPFSPTVQLYYGNDVQRFLSSRNFNREVDTYFYYSSASTQLLTIALSRALQAKNPTLSVSDYLREKIWKPLGMDADALWHTDAKGMELGYCCINTNARNFAKLGQLMLQKGSWNEQQVVSESFIEKMHTSKFQEDYGYSTWLGNYKGSPYYFFLGHLGQYIIVVPQYDLVVVRLGKTKGDIEREDIVNKYIEEALLIING
jgi:CubicO group peptidase (beta-lactamase class C family)